MMNTLESQYNCAAHATAQATAEPQNTADPENTAPAAAETRWTDEDLDRVVMRCRD